VEPVAKQDSSDIGNVVMVLTYAQAQDIIIVVRGSLIGAKCLMRYLRSLVQDESRHCIAKTAVATVGHVEVVAVEHIVERHFT
jgi:hypothetical protein